MKSRLIKNGYIFLLLFSFFSIVNLTINAQSQVSINLIDHYGGFITQIGNNNQYLLICQSHSVKIANLVNDQPNIIATALTPWEIWEIYSDASSAFISKQNMIMSVNFSNTANITSSQQVSLGQTNAETITSIYANSQYVFTTQLNSNTKTGAFRILNRNNLTQLGSVNIVSQQVQVVNNIAYVITGHLSMGAASQKLKAYDISNPSNIVEVGSLDLNNCEEVYVTENYAYVVGTGRTGLTIVDITNPANMTITANQKGPASSLKHIIVIGNYAYASGVADFFTIDISNKSNPTQLATINIDPSPIPATIMTIVIYPTAQEPQRSCLLHNGYLKLFDISTAGNIAQLNPFNSPLTTDCMAVYQNYLFVGDGSKIWKCPNNNIQVNNHFITTKNSLMKTHDGILYVVSRDESPNKLTLFDISDLNNPVKKGEYTTTNTIMNFDVWDKNAYLLFLNTPSLEVINCSSPDTPTKTSTFSLSGAGYEIFISASDKTAYIGCYNSAIGLKEVALLNITNPSSLSLISKFAVYAVPYAIHLDGNTLFVGGSKTGVGEWFLQAWDVTNKVTPTLLTQISQTGVPVDEGLFDLYATNNKLVVTIKGIGIRTYELISSSGAAYFKEVGKISLAPIFNQTGENTGFTFAQDLTVYKSGSDLYGYANGVPSGTHKGYKGTFKFKIPEWFPPDPDKVYLTMKVNPAEALQHDCNTIPAPGGPYGYTKNDIASLIAKDNPPAGWNFKEWTGDASGKSKNTAIIMDRDKTAIANFVEVVLTVSGSALEEAVCPEKAFKGSTKMLPINLCASDASAWIVQGITFKTHGTGDESKDIIRVNVYQGPTLIANINYPNYPSDNGKLHITFKPSVIVPAGECANLTLHYDFLIRENFYDTTSMNATLEDTTYTYFVETDKVTAVPFEYDEGLIQGEAKRKGAFTIARIYNDNGVGFSRIQDAVNSNLTQDKNTCYLCDGGFRENVLIDNKSKEVTIKPVNGKGKTILRPKNKDYDVFKINGKSSIKIQDIIFDVGSFINGLGFAISAYKSESLQLENNNFNYFKTAIALGIDTKNCIIEKNTFYNNDQSIGLSRASNNIIAYNTFKQNDSKEPDISVYAGIKNDISKNEIDNDGSLTILLYGTTQNKIFNNVAYLPSRWAKYSSIILQDSDQNSIAGNICYQVEVENSNSNSFYNNQLLTIQLNNSELNDIKNNIISGKDRVDKDGINIKSCNKTFISENTINANNGNGISTYESLAQTIRKNSIHDNTQDGILAYFSPNASITGNTIYDNLKNGIYFSFSNDAGIFENKISGHKRSYFTGGGIKKAAGIYLFEGYRSHILKNVLKYNCTGIETDGSEANINSNEISNSTCSNTGIHIRNSKTEISNNNIINNNGEGIYFSSNSSGSVNSNNIYGNSGKELNNANSSITIDASNNWWGNNSGPSSSDYEGKFNITNWLSSPVSLTCTTKRDTLYLMPGATDSTTVLFQNFQYPADVLDITISDTRGWIYSPKTSVNQMKDSLGTSSIIVIKVPAGTSPGSLNKISIQAKSRSAINISAKDSFYVKVYTPLLKEIKIIPDSVTITVADSVRLFAIGYDQNGNTVSIIPKWSTNFGQITSSRFFKSPNPGKAEITVTDSLSGLKAKSIILVTTIVGIEKIAELPSSYKLYQNYPNPFNSETTIRYRIQAISNIRITVYDVLGRELTTLVNEEKSPGTYEVKFNAERSRGIASGVFIYQLRAGNYISTKKMLFLK